MGVAHECFASPLNRSFDSFSSLFVSRDCFFGSRGNFFDMNVGEEGGSYEANPPFDPSTVHKMFVRIRELLDGVGSGKPASFVVVLPKIGQLDKYLTGQDAKIGAIDPCVHRERASGASTKRRFDDDI
jgi:hypothetical protein